jgi:peptidoglycan/LPS O-acetylase OafA/YrhL
LSSLIQALRAIAVSAVVLFHLWPAQLTGGYVGVDVFFVISGYLITGHLLREVEKTKSLRLGAFWARRIRRLLPAALTVVVATLIGVVLFAPVQHWGQYISEMWASIGLVENWKLAGDAVDYFAAASPSPLQHYWSLSVEEQFYIVWPLLLFGIAALGRRVRRPRFRVVALAVAVLLGTLSLAYSIAISIADNSFGYFSTFSHAWEFLAGGAVAIVGGRIERVADRTNHASAIGGALALLGAATILATASLFDGATPFPGFAAALPVGGALVVLFAVPFVGNGRISSFLRVRPLAFLGDASYSIYLWHWPLIVLAPFALDRALTALDKVVILCVTLALAFLTKRYIEDAVRSGALARRRSTVTFLAGATAAAIVVAASLAPFGVFSAQRTAAITSAEELYAGSGETGLSCFGPNAVLRPDPETCTASHTLDPRVAELTPWLATVDEVAGGPDPAWTANWSRCPKSTGTAITTCEFGDPAAPVHVVIVGDSHGFQWSHAVLPIAEKNGWRVSIVWSAGCALTEPGYELLGGGTTDAGRACEAWRAAMLNGLSAPGAADIVITSAFSHSHEIVTDPENAPGAQAAFDSAIQRLLDSGRRVAVIADSPLGVSNIPDCLLATRVVDDPCTFPRSEAAGVDPLASAALSIANPRLEVVDLTDLFCDATTCHSVIGGVAAYSDRHHLSSGFLRGLWPAIEPTLLRLLNR